jgi:hypothetical protein
MATLWMRNAKATRLWAMVQQQLPLLPRLPKHALKPTRLTAE